MVGAAQVNWDESAWVASQPFQPESHLAEELEVEERRQRAGLRWQV